MRPRCGWLIAMCALVGCSLEPVAAGGECKRSTECREGLACVEGRCSRDLGPIADESTVPDLGMGEDAAVPAADGG